MDKIVLHLEVENSEAGIATLVNALHKLMPAKEQKQLKQNPSLVIFNEYVTQGDGAGIFTKFAKYLLVDLNDLSNYVSFNHRGFSSTVRHPIAYFEKFLRAMGFKSVTNSLLSRFKLDLGDLADNNLYIISVSDYTAANNSESAIDLLDREMREVENVIMPLVRRELSKWLEDHKSEFTPVPEGIVVQLNKFRLKLLETHDFKQFKTQPKFLDLLKDNGVQILGSIAKWSSKTNNSVSVNVIKIG